MDDNTTWKVAALYRFVRLEDIPALRQDVQGRCDALGICGTLLLAPEGVNGTIAGLPDQLDEIVRYLDAKFGVSQGELKYSAAAGKPFNRMKVRPKKEIITMRAPEADPTVQVGTYVEPEDWNALISDPEVLLVDTRNDYETKLGIFEGAVDPDIKVFTAFKDYVEKNLDPAKHKKVAMFCTGGIRCEKASSYMLAHGFDEVYHLKGGILKYLETVPADESKWKGDCFVFDHRVAVGQGLAENPDWSVCFGCREPLSAEDRESPSYEQGVSCPHCIDSLDDDRAKALRMRHRHFMEHNGQTRDENGSTAAI